MGVRAGFGTTAMLLLLSHAAMQDCANALAAAKPKGGGAYATGHYRNLLEEAGHSQAEIETRIRGSFDQLFHGDAHTQAIYFAAGSNVNGPLAYITDVANHDARTEGMSYGMSDRGADRSQG